MQLPVYHLLALASVALGCAIAQDKPGSPVNWCACYGADSVDAAANTAVCASIDNAQLYTLPNGKQVCSGPGKDQAITFGQSCLGKGAAKALCENAGDTSATVWPTPP